MCVCVCVRRESTHQSHIVKRQSKAQLLLRPVVEDDMTTIQLQYLESRSTYIITARSDLCVQSIPMTCLPLLSNQPSN